MLAIPRDQTTDPMLVARIAENAAMLHCHTPIEVTCNTGAGTDAATCSQSMKVTVRALFKPDHRRCESRRLAAKSAARSRVAFNQIDERTVYCA